jgi:hypothetical protein
MFINAGEAKRSRNGLIVKNAKRRYEDAQCQRNPKAFRGSRKFLCAAAFIALQLR